MSIKNFIAKMIGKKIAKDLKLEEGNMEKKKWWQSKTIWSDVLTVVSGIYAVLTPVLAAHGHTLPEVPGWLIALLGGVGIHGRVTADSKIG